MSSTTSRSIRCSAPKRARSRAASSPAATRVEVMRASTVDPYGRTLGYLFVDGRNASVLIIEARLAYESVTQFGDNGFPAEAALIKGAAEKAGPLPFEQPYQFRGRMRDVTKWMKAQGIYPAQ